ncbi:hypothetical protein LCE31_39530, partial [Streptomyces sp. 8L]|nr:hypothetical protein [Streptomyces sp. 8L]
VVLVAAVAGLAGVGKTELAVQAATRALGMPGWFPGGVLFADLNGYDPEPQRRLGAHQVLGGWLRDMGMPAEHVPDTEAGRVSLFRSVLAAYAGQGRRVLVVVDNAGSEDQARPLLPTDQVTGAVVTSRHTLDLGARLHELTVLDEESSVDLLRQALRVAHGAADTRVEDDAGQALRLARLCAGLPLALRIIAARLADPSRPPLSAMADALQSEHTRLDRIRRTGTGRQDAGQAVRAAFDLSYQYLTDAQAQLFRLLPLNAGPEVSTLAAAHLLGPGHPDEAGEEAAGARDEAVVDAYTAGELLGDLARAHLVDPAAGSWGRWRIHDLVRLYAHEHGRRQAGPDRREQAATRLLDHYLATAEAAGTHLDTRPDRPRSEAFTGRQAALAWLDAERTSMTAAATSTTGSPSPPPRPASSNRPATATAKARR